MKNQIFKLLVLFVFSSSILISTTSAEIPNANKIDSIYEWVKSFFEESEDIGRPEIYFVNRPELQQFFEQSNEKTYRSWQETYGEKKAAEIMEIYLTELQGLFNPDDSIVYIGDFLESCKLESVLAHELSHYVQEVKKVGVGAYVYGYGANDMKHTIREMQAYGLQKKYMKEFCNDVPQGGSDRQDSES